MTYNGVRSREAESSLTSLRKDNEVKLKEEKIVCNNNDRESVVELCGLQFQGNE